LVIAAAAAIGLFLIIQLNFLIVPLLIAVLLAALAAPLAIGLRRLRFPRWLATLTTLIVFVALVTGLVWLVVGELVRGWESLRDRTIIAYDDFVLFLLESPLEVSEAQLNTWFAVLMEQSNIDSAWVLSGALSVTSSVGSRPRPTSRRRSRLRGGARGGPWWGMGYRERFHFAYRGCGAALEQPLTGTGWCALSRKAC